MWISLNTQPVPMLSVPANTPPGRSTRATSPNTRSCALATGMWWSMVKHTTAEKRPSA